MKIVLTTVKKLWLVYELIGNDYMSDRLNKSDEVLKTLRRIIRVIDLHSKKLVQKYGLTGPQMLVLKELLSSKQLPISSLAKNVSLSHATVTSMLDRLEKKGYVQRMRDDKDKRKIFVKATELAQKVFETAPNLLQENFVETFYKLEDWEQTLILSSLQRVASMMGAKTIDAAPILVVGEINASSDMF
jgi:DNA-binding MarR family transcriptional regulator